jgi:hypothetical protein
LCFCGLSNKPNFSIHKKKYCPFSLVVWLPTTKSQESTQLQRLQEECYMALESSQRELQDRFRPHPNQRYEQEVMDAQSPGSPTRDSFGTPPWESREKVSFGCSSRGELQRILYGGRWWLPLSPARGESSESKVARGLSQHQKGVEWVLTNLWLVLDVGPCNKIIAPLPSLIPGLLTCPSYPPFSVGSWERHQVPTPSAFPRS